MNSQQQPQPQTQQASPSPAELHPPQESPTESPSDTSSAKQTLQGTSHDMTNDQTLHEVIEQAFDYRGDVTIHTADGRIVEGYIFDRRATGSESYLRVIPTGTTQRVTIQYHEMTRIEFTGRDTGSRQELGDVGQKVPREKSSRRGDRPAPRSTR